VLNGCAVLESFWIVFWRGIGKLMRVLDEVEQFWDRVQFWTSFHASSSMQNSIVKYSTPFPVGFFRVVFCWSSLVPFIFFFFLMKVFLNKNIIKRKLNRVVKET
jgi:hypothetical protein